MILMAALGFFVTDFARDLVAPDGKSFRGNFLSTQFAPAITTRHQYSFRCASNC